MTYNLIIVLLLFQKNLTREHFRHSKFQILLLVSRLIKTMQPSCCEIFANKMKLEDRPLVSVRKCLIFIRLHSIYGGHFGHSQSQNVPCHDGKMEALQNFLNKMLVPAYCLGS